jgi:hypothetical protein
MTAVRLPQNVTAIHLLHGFAGRVPAGTEIATLTVHYEDGAVLSLPVKSGTHVRAAEDPPGAPADPLSAVAWTGSDDRSLTVYRSKFVLSESPRKPALLGITSAGSAAAPFVLSIAVESGPIQNP